MSFLQSEVEFLGHRLTSEGIGAQPEKVDALQGWKTPFTTPKQVKSFLGCVCLAPRIHCPFCDPGRSLCLP